MRLMGWHMSVGTDPCMRVAWSVRVFRVHEMFMEMFKEPNDDVHLRVCWWVWIELSAIAVRLAAAVRIKVC